MKSTLAKPYALILGESPSRGAKSPTLWNAAYQGLGLPCAMRPRDVRPGELRAVIQELKSDRQFIGGAVTIPYKREVMPLLDKIEPEAKTIGAVNCIYREGDSLVGANTDGAGALESLKHFMGSGTLKGACVAVIGIGGAGRAVACSMAHAIGKTGTLILVNRTVDRAREMAILLQDVCRTPVSGTPVESSALESASILINASSVGFEMMREDEGVYTLAPFTSLGPVVDTLRVPPGEDARDRFMRAAQTFIESNLAMSRKILEATRPQIVFDIVYQPPETPLLRLAKSMGIRCLNGRGMNLEQAVIAFERTHRSSFAMKADSTRIRALMKAVL